MSAAAETRVIPDFWSSDEIATELRQTRRQIRAWQRDPDRMPGTLRLPNGELLSPSEDLARLLDAMFSIENAETAA